MYPSGGSRREVKMVATPYPPLNTQKRGGGGKKKKEKGRERKEGKIECELTSAKIYSKGKCFGSVHVLLTKMI